MNIFNVLQQRGFIAQTSNAVELEHKLNNEQVVFYTGFDPTADSLTAGHFIPIMVMMHLISAGHKPIVLLGGGTGIIGDPTDKSDMRRVLTRDEVKHNVECMKKQLQRFIGDDAIFVDNAEWLLDLKYVEFIRTYGIHFSVNKMLTADTYRKRFERGLSFYEFNYMLMQAYDFLELHNRYGCTVEIGGNDQWSNILAGVDLVRRCKSKTVYGLTLELLTTSRGEKMGKSMSGAIWLDANKTTPHEFFQYWRNIDDADVQKCFNLLTFENDVPDEINVAKEKLAYEITKLVHGEAEATIALKSARTLFSGEGDIDSIPCVEISRCDNILDLLVQIQFAPSKSEARRLISQGGIKINGDNVSDYEHQLTLNDFTIQKGKKTFKRIKFI